MSKERHALPESLELLLDTMCNTFGGIMFIAISLLVISQMMTHAISTMIPEKLDEALLQGIRMQIEKLQDEILLLRQEEMAEKIRAAQKQSTQEQVVLLQQLLEEKKKRSSSQNELDKLKTQHQIAVADKKRRHSKFQSLVQTRIRREQELKQQRSDALKENQRMKSELKALEKKLANTPPAKIRFSMETSTLLRPYWIFLQENRIYRWGDQICPVTGEVQKVEDSGRNVHFEMVQGTALNKDAEKTLHFLLQNADPMLYYVKIAMDYKSFRTLVTVKRYLRSRGIKVFWDTNPGFQYVYSNHVDNRASD